MSLFSLLYMYAVAFFCCRDLRLFATVGCCLVALVLVFTPTCFDTCCTWAGDLAYTLHTTVSKILNVKGKKNLPSWQLVKNVDKLDVLIDSGRQQVIDHGKLILRAASRALVMRQALAWA
jgi:hypothetical protein